MTVSRLIALLQRRLATHGDREVLVTWESVFRDVETGTVYLDKRGALLIDADDNYYKPRFAVDPTEGDGEVFDE